MREVDDVTQTQWEYLAFPLQEPKGLMKADEPWEPDRPNELAAQVVELVLREDDFPDRAYEPCSIGTCGRRIPVRFSSRS